MKLVQLLFRQKCLTEINQSAEAVQFFNHMTDMIAEIFFVK